MAVGGFRTGMYHVGSFFRGYIDRAHDEKAGNPRKNGGIHYAQSGDSVNAKFRIENSAILFVSDFAGAGGVVSPGIVVNELAQPVTGEVGSRKLFFHERKMTRKL